MAVLGVVIRDIECRALPIFPFYVVFENRNFTPIVLPLNLEYPYVPHSFPGNRGFLHDMNRMVDNQLIVLVNQDVGLLTANSFYKVLHPYLQLEIVYRPQKQNATIQLLLNKDLFCDHWRRGTLPPATTYVPVLRKYIQELHNEFVVRVNDNILPHHFQDITREVEGFQHHSSTPLFAHQVEGVLWMAHVERQIVNNLPIGYVHPAMPLFCENMFWDGTRLTTSQDPVALYSRGGMIGDGIGSGKTLQMLALIVTDLLQLKASQRPVAGVRTELFDLQSNATLVVCGKQLAEQWRQQVTEHFKEVPLQIVCITDKVHHDKTTYEMLLNADLVIVTMSFLIGDYYRQAFIGQRIEADMAPMERYYGLLATKWPTHLRMKPVLELIHFRRLVLDEADMYLYKLPYMNPELEHAYNRRLSQHCRVNYSRKTEPFVYVQCLQSTFRWLVTSTANFTDFSQQAAFVSYLGLRTVSNVVGKHHLFMSTPRTWSPLGQHLSLDTAMVSASVIEKWMVKQSFLQHVLLARSQEYVFNSMALPDLESEVLWIDYSDAERNLVQSALALDEDYDYRRRVHAFPVPTAPSEGGQMSIQQATEQMQRTQQQRLSELEETLRNLRTSVVEVDRVQQTAPDILANLLNHRYQQVVQEIETTEQNIAAVQRSMHFLEASLQSTDPCSICFDAFTDTVTSCGHKFCSVCLQRCLQERARCPTCRAEVSLERCIRLLVQSDDYGSRFRELLRYIQSVREADASAQFVVFSEWEKELKKQKRLLKSEAGLRCAQIKGNTAVCQHHVQQFQVGEIDVLFLSLQSMASGLHLVCANHVIILTPLGAPFARAEQIERQAIGRCHRVGQTRKVHVRHILVRNSLEEDIWRERSLQAPITNTTRAVQESKEQ